MYLNFVASDYIELKGQDQFTAQIQAQVNSQILILDF